MSGHVSFELQTYTGGVWKIDSVYDDREIALFEAKRVHESGRYSAVRVIEERYNHASGNYVLKTVFRASKTEAANAEVLERRKIARQELQETRWAAGNGEIEQSAAGRPGLPRKSGPGPMVLTLLFGVIVIAGIGMIIGIRYLFALI